MAYVLQSRNPVISKVLPVIFLQTEVDFLLCAESVWIPRIRVAGADLLANRLVFSGRYDGPPDLTCGTWKEKNEPRHEIKTCIRDV